MFRYVLDRGMSEVSQSGFETCEEAEAVGREEAAYIRQMGLDCFFSHVEEEEEEK